jgi:dihydropteroate synthase
MFVTPVTSDRRRLIEEIKAVGADPYAVQMWERGEPMSVKVSAVSAFAANVIKQEALASGIDAAVNRGAANCSVEKNDLLIIGNVRGMKILTRRLKKQGGVLETIACEIECVINSAEGMYTLRFSDRVLTFTNLIMGILNVTPDSFSDGGCYDTPDKVKDRLKQIFDEGALIADIGGVSTRPGYAPVDASEEERRVLPAVEEGVRIASDYGGFISIDTSTPAVAEKALALGADMINDQRALETPGMAEICAKYRAAVVLMHNVQNMTDSMTDDIPAAMAEVKAYLARAAERAVSMGIDRESVVLDPGFGFGKSLKIQYTILKYFRELCSLAYPVLAGISRKSMLGVISGRTTENRDYLTAAAETAAALSGASIIRTHNVAAARDVFSVTAALEVRK